MRKGLLVMLVCIVALSLVLVPAWACAPAKPTGNPIKVGILAPTKLPVGMRFVYGAQVAEDEINAAGGIKVGNVKRPLQVVVVDTNEYASTPDAVSACERAITVDKVDFIISGTTTEPCLAMQDVACDYKKLFLLSGTAGLGITDKIAKNYDKYKYTFRIQTTTMEMGVQMIDQIRITMDLLKKELGITNPKTAILAEKLAWADGIIMGFKLKEEIAKNGGEVIGEWRPAANATDLTAELTAMKGKDTQMIVTLFSAVLGYVYPRQWYELQVPAASVGMLDVNETGLEASKGGLNYALGWQCIGPAEITPKTLPWTEKYLKKSNGLSPSSRHPEAYSLIYMYKDAVEKAGTLDSDTLVPLIEQTDFVGPGGRYVFNPKDSPVPHQAKFGKGYITDVGLQYQNNVMKVVWPPADGSFQGIVYKGVAPLQLPPWVVKYWKK